MSARIDQFLGLIHAWRSGDVEDVLSRMDEDIVWHFAAGVEAPIRGKAQARKFLVRFASQIRDIRWRIFHHAETGDRLFVEGVDEYTTTAGVRVAAPYAGVLEFKGERVVGWRDYVDVGVIARQTAGEPLSSAVETLIARPSMDATVEAGGHA